MNSYRMSNGEKIKKSEIDSKIRKAKSSKLEQMMIEHGYHFCQDCKRSTGVRLDCSHDVSVDRCQKNGESERAWDVLNITIRCRECHVKHD